PNVHGDERNDQRNQRDRQEIPERLQRYTTYTAQVAHTGDTVDHATEDDRGHDHPHETDEGIAERLHALGQLRFEVPERDARCRPNEHLEPKLPDQTSAPDRVKHAAWEIPCARCLRTASSAPPR